MTLSQILYSFTFQAKKWSAELVGDDYDFFELVYNIQTNQQQMNINEWSFKSLLLAR